MDEHKDRITVQNDTGEERDLIVEALFDIEKDSYALLKDENETFLMRVEQNGDEQALVPIEDPVVRDSILDAYEIALEATPGDNEDF
ncbi:DUF1292 domain-containing protein [Aquisalibacillus elongatus]|uniref:Uncharacterized protein DUF1292 n=1 Tax=Aquisalibacillus elongatus TaxID=485577 RepID=A0A3N5C1A9_9BACI|nr:DUF1292 domain-containing protein [Aquisalibacillus elongatus]RPF55858.1 uncharacterized protein DUF1292 [Aquisalibacillus elongatus]